MVTIVIARALALREIALEKEKENKEVAICMAENRIDRTVEHR